MHLKQLELSGFKSFAKTTVLSFPSRVTAIVGPNGSGKSNITEGIRWVLGEQSMKILRGKKGEDLVWNGSASGGGGGVSRMGKAAVSLTFDNKNGEIPIDFPEVTLMRKIFRDGANEYLINDSVVRLKDVVELIARMGLGEQKHNIIGQGEVDRLLLATPRQRREMLEEALGLRVWQLKKNEAERKLETTMRNMERADALVRELTPHLKFLRMQAKRAEAREGTRKELGDAERVYLAREERDISDESAALAARRAPLVEKEAALRREIARLSAEVEQTEKDIALPEQSRMRERDIAADTAKRIELEREIGRLEGRMEAVRQDPAASPRAFGAASATERMRDIFAKIRSLIREQDDIEIVRQRFFPLMEQAERVVEAFVQGDMAPIPPMAGMSGANAQAEALENSVRVLGTALETVLARIAAAEEDRRREAETARAAHTRLRDVEQTARGKRDRERENTIALERLKFDEERIAGRRSALHEMRRDAIGDATLPDEALLAVWRDKGQAEIHRVIERLKARLEESGGIDPAVVKEYEDTETRHAFLTKEREDVASAAGSLGELVKELDARIAQDFTDGFAKIKDAFHEYFRIVFGGGTGKLRLSEREPRALDETEAEEKETSDEGIEIEVDLPRKRIHGLAMLSGGERALTAIALLFAITAVNPPPFLILDETDAALDEANSQRYAAILKELAKKTQLIVITHNRETMKSAGVLYGVTMGDDGVSRLLSLKLEEAEEYTSC